jgi:hypothetical protein
MELDTVLHRIAPFARDMQDMLWRLVFAQTLVAGYSRAGGLTCCVDVRISSYIIRVNSHCSCNCYEEKEE